MRTGDSRLPPPSTHSRPSSVAGRTGDTGLTRAGVLPPAYSARRPHPAGSPQQALRIAGAVLLAGYVCLLGLLATRPGPTAWMPEANFVPFATIRSELATGTACAWWQLLRGMLVMAPLGVLLPMAGGRLHVSPLWSFLRTTGTAMLLATWVEALQTGVAGKVLDVDDIVLAVIGVMLAHLAVVPATRAALLRRRVPASRREAPGKGRGAVTLAAPPRGRDQPGTSRTRATAAADTP